VRNLVAERGQLVTAAPAPGGRCSSISLAARFTRLLVHSQPGSTPGAHSSTSALAAEPLAVSSSPPSMLDQPGAVPLDVQIDIAVEVQQVQQLFEIVARDLASATNRSSRSAPGGRRRTGVPFSPFLLVHQLVGAFCRFPRPSCLSLPHPPDTAPVNVSVFLGRAPGAESHPGVVRVARCLPALGLVALESGASPVGPQLGPRRLRIGRGVIRSGLHLARADSLSARCRRVGRPPSCASSFLASSSFFDVSKHVVLLRERPDVVREPVEDDRQRQEQSAETTTPTGTRTASACFMIAVCGLAAASGLCRAIDARAVQVRRDARHDHHRQAYSDDCPRLNSVKRVQSARLSHRRAQRRARTGSHPGSDRRRTG